MNRNRIEFDYYITPDGLTLDLNQWGTRYLLGNLQGTGMPPIKYYTQQGPGQHGTTPVSYRLDPRVITMVIRQNGLSRDQYWDIRENFIDYFRPNRGGGIGQVNRGTLRKIRPDGSIRDLSVVVSDGPKFNGRDQSWDEFSVHEAIRMTAHDPVYYDPESIEVVPTFTAADSLIFPFEFPFQFALGVITGNFSITYRGTWPAFPVMRIYGPINRPTLTNLTTDEELTFNYTLASGAYLDIDTRYGEKTVIDNLGISRIGTLTATSDLSTFHLAPASEVAGGINNFVLGGSEAAGAAFSIVYNERYVAI